MEYSAPEPRKTEWVTEQFEKPLQDLRQYRLLRLENQLEVFLVSDDQAEIASASMDVNAGSFNDASFSKAKLLGMAHGVEHVSCIHSSPLH